MLYMSVYFTHFCVNVLIKIRGTSKTHGTPCKYYAESLLKISALISETMKCNPVNSKAKKYNTFLVVSYLGLRRCLKSLKRFMSLAFC